MYFGDDYANNPFYQEFGELVEKLKSEAKDMFNAGEIYRENFDQGLRDIANNDLMDEFFELANEDSDERERLVYEAVEYALDYVMKLVK
jgi:hypothetical protein